jgi:hypothetical protein
VRHPIGDLERLFDWECILARLAGPKGQRVQHPVPAPPPAARRHCWVAGSDDAPGPHAGLVIGWERRETGWFAQVAYFIEGDAAMAVQWLPTDLVSPDGR